jgi:NADH-quinone oxidoreductase subunit L
MAIFVIALPLLSSIICGILNKHISHKLAGMISVTSMILTAVLGMQIFINHLSIPTAEHIIIAEWFSLPFATVHWALYIDQLTAIMFMVVTLVSAVVHIYSLGYMRDDVNLPRFMSYLSLFTFFMLILVSADNFVQLFFGWEGVGLCSYLLIGFWYTKPSACSAAQKAFIVNRIGDCALILGIILIIYYCRSVSFLDVFAQSEKLSSLYLMDLRFSVLDAICLLLFIGCMGKSAQIGLHVWLADAMEGPTPVSALIHAATMVTAGVFLVARASFLFELSPSVLQIIAYVGAITCLFAASIAIMQNDIKKIIAYSTCSQLGYMFIACGVSAYGAAIFHLATHAFFKALLFLCAGSVIHATHEQDITKLGGLRSTMPYTYALFWLGSLAIMGIFPFAGYYSKDMILESAFAAREFAGNGIFVLGIVAAFLTACYSLKIILLVFHGTTHLSEKAMSHVHESKIMLAPLLLLTLGAIGGGVYGYYFMHIGEVGGYFDMSVASATITHAHVSPYIQFLPLGVAIGGAGFAFVIFTKSGPNAEHFQWIRSLLANKYYFDEIYDVAIVKKTEAIGFLCQYFDLNIIDRYGPTYASRLVQLLSSRLRKIQSGYIFNYALVMLCGVIVVMSGYLVNYISGIV